MTVVIKPGANTLDVTMNLSMGVLTGKVINKAEAGIPGVAVVLTETDGGTAGSATTDDQGNYRMEIVPGDYAACTFSKDGYDTAVIDTLP